jgi:hypothetical protein
MLQRTQTIPIVFTNAGDPVTLLNAAIDGGEPTLWVMGYWTNGTIRVGFSRE